jgi:hypothetical protein
MKPGFKNFQTVSKGVPLAVSDGQLITAKKTAKILMPLYQSKGLDGYFLVKPTPSFFYGCLESLDDLKSIVYFHFCPE